MLINPLITGNTQVLDYSFEKNTKFKFLQCKQIKKNQNYKNFVWEKIE